MRCPTACCFRLRSSRLILPALAALILATTAAARERSDTSAGRIADQLQTIRAVQPAGGGHTAAQEAVQQLSSLPPSYVVAVLEAMKGANPLAKNWLRIVAAAVADNGDFPRQELLAFFKDRSHDPDARHAAFQMLIAADAQSEAKLLAGAETDPSLPVRHLAVERLIERAADSKQDGETESAIETYRLILAEARNAEQLKTAAGELEKLDQPVDLAEELRMVRRWWSIGTFDNTDSKHFDTVYRPEETYLAESRLPEDWLADDAKVDNNGGTASVHRIDSDDSLGMVNLNPTFDDAKGAIAYAYIEFTVDSESTEADGLDAEVRLGCINANKVWVNGRQVISNEVYHAGTRIDQYVGECRLKPGKNTVLLKVCQNAQTEAWAQDWQFQFRFTDLGGAGIKVNVVEPEENKTSE